MNLDFNFENPYLKYFVLVLVIFFVARIISRMVKKLLHAFFEEGSKNLKNNPTSYKFIKNAVGFFVYIIAFVLIFYLVPEMKELGVTLLASAGIFTAVLAMASSQVFSNIISGVFIVIFKPFRVEDRIKIGNNYIGLVEDITLRHTVIKDFENQRVIIPNSIISSETVLNISIVDEAVCNYLEIPVPYYADIDKVKKIIKESALKHPNFVDKRTEEEIENGVDILPVRIIGIDNSFLNFRANIWTDNAAKGFALKCDVREEILRKMRSKNIILALPSQQVVLKK